MVRAPCCEKMGLKKGPWTPEEDQILVAYIQRYGHGNWRALPKQAGLLRCGKSCRLRWTNYLRPDIKRGNFSKEEEETIIKLHEMLGNRWSAIASRLPGRTDNEIKNVWHTHLKKRVKPNQIVQESKRRTQWAAKTEIVSNPITLQLSSNVGQPRLENPESPARSCSDVMSFGTDSSEVTGENYSGEVKEEKMDSLLEFPELDDSFWSEALSMKNSIAPMDIMTIGCLPSGPMSEPFCSFSSSNADMNFWLTTFTEAGDLLDLPQI